MRALGKITNVLFISYDLEPTALMLEVTRSFLGKQRLGSTSDLHFNKTPKKVPCRCHMRSVYLQHFFIHRATDSSKIYGAGKTESLAMPTSTTMQPTLSSGIRPGSSWAGWRKEPLAWGFFLFQYWIGWFCAMSSKPATHFGMLNECY